MTREEQIERAQIEEVFRVQGQLGDRPWEGHRFWYDGAPEYATEFRNTDKEYVTLLWDHGSYGDNAPPEVIKVSEGDWKKVASFSTSGEVECPLSEEEDDVVLARCKQHGDTMGVAGKFGPERETRYQCSKGCGLVAKDAADGCPMCEEPPGANHGFVYLGDGWAEVVYELEPIPCTGPGCDEGAVEREDGMIVECAFCNGTGHGRRMFLDEFRYYAPSAFNFGSSTCWVTPGALALHKREIGDGEEVRLARVIDRVFFDGQGRSLQGIHLRCLVANTLLTRGHYEYLPIESFIEVVSASEEGFGEFAKFFFAPKLPDGDTIVKMSNYGSLADSYIENALKRLKEKK